MTLGTSPTPNIFDALSTPIPIERIEFRVQSVKGAGWAILLAYKDARVDMDRLDQVVGRGFWKREHQVIGNHLFCTVSLYNRELEQWVSVQDVGTPSNTEAVKGEASDSFKRACFNLGIGRELYDYPFIMVQLAADEFEMVEDRGKQVPRATYKFKLKEWGWFLTSHQDETGRHVVDSLIGIDDKGVERYRFPRRNQSPGGTQQPPPQSNNRGAQQRR